MPSSTKSTSQPISQSDINGAVETSRSKGGLERDGYQRWYQNGAAPITSRTVTVFAVSRDLDPDHLPKWVPDASVEAIESIGWPATRLQLHQHFWFDGTPWWTATLDLANGWSYDTQIDWDGQPASQPTPVGALVRLEMFIYDSNVQEQPFLTKVAPDALPYPLGSRNRRPRRRDRQNA